MIRERVGVHGRASLKFGLRGGATVVTGAWVQAPVKIVRPFASADGRLIVPLITVGPGLCGRDSCTIDVHVESGARVVITTTAATRVLGMAEADCASQRVHLAADAGAHVEYYPGLTIPFPDSSFEQHIAVSASSDARVGVLETWALGRAARGEYLRFRRLCSRTTLHVDGVLTYADATVLDPQQADLAGVGVLDGRRYLASGFWQGAELPAGTRGDDIAEAAGITIAAFGQSAPGLVFLRALGQDGIALDTLIAEVLQRVSSAWRVPTVRLERFRC